ncbi:DUF6049 family protein [Kitasatospora sp. MBT63]|uniref:DUF6049 family protein n=1 Tax=Kitasatospora sp. MBT63 TaxID=1444768 RepID=UPI0011EA70A8|nr:DUF6049 family protein [Kitasatospora sp. MBT63]
MDQRSVGSAPAGVRRTALARRAVRRLGGLLAAGTVLLTATALPAAASPAAPAAPAADYPAAMTISTVTPAVAGENGTVTVTGKVVNSGHGDIKSAHIGVRAPVSGKKLGTRNEVMLVAQRSTPTGTDGVDVTNAEVPLGDLTPGQSHDFSIPVATADLELSKSGVYELAVDVWGTSGGGHERVLGIARTFLPYNVEPTDKQTQLSVVWPITHAPELVAQTMPDNDQTPVLRDDSLVGELSPGGRLHQLVTTGATLPNLTWMVDPDLLDTVFAMTKPYRVQKPNTGGESAREDNTVPGTGRDAAVSWLALLRTSVATAGDEVVSLPYADPDLASIAHNGASLPGMETALRKASTAGRLTAAGRLAVDVKSDVAWPYQGRLDRRTAATALTAGGQLVLVDGASMPEADSLAYTPAAARPIGNGQTAVVADPTISGLFQQELRTPEARTEAVQRFLAETLLVNRQMPEQSRGLLVLPPRNLDATTAGVLADAVLKSRQGGWTAPVTLHTLAAVKADPDATTAVQDGYPQELAATELSSSALGKTMSLQNSLDQLMLILTQPQRVRGPFSAAMVRSMSTQWRDQSTAGVSYRDGVQHYLDNLTSAVRLPPKSDVTLPGDNATLQVSVKNDLNQAVGNLELRLTSSQLNRLNVGPAESVVLDGTTSRTFRFPAEAQVNGSVQMTAQLWTTGPNPQRYGAPVTFMVEVTSVTNGVLYVIGGGVVLMVLAGIRFSLQRKKRAAGEDGGADGPADADDAPGDGDPRAGPEPAATGDDTAGGTADSTAGAGTDAEPESAAETAVRATGDEKVGH